MTDQSVLEIDKARFVMWLPSVIGRKLLLSICYEFRISSHICCALIVGAAVDDKKMLVTDTTRGAGKHMGMVNLGLESPQPIGNR